MERIDVFTQEIADLVCETIVKSDRGIHWHSRNTPGFPKPATIYNWIEKHKSFGEQYAQAKVRQMDWIAEQIFEISDDSRNDFIVGDDGKRIVNQEHIQRSRLRIDTRKWVMSKLVPKKWGDKIEVEATVTDLSLTPAERDRRLSEIAAVVMARVGAPSDETPEE